MLKKLKHKGVAMVEYGVLLAFVCGIGGLYMSDTSLSASIDNTITKVVKLLEGEDFAGEDYITSYKNKLDGLFEDEVYANGGIVVANQNIWDFGRAIVSNKPDSIKHHLNTAGLNQYTAVAIDNSPQKNYKDWLDTLSRNGESVTDKACKVVIITATDPQTNTKYEIQYAYSFNNSFKAGYTTLLGSRVIEK